MSRRSTQTLIKVEIAAIVVLLLAFLAYGQNQAAEGDTTARAATESSP